MKYSSKDESIIVKLGVSTVIGYVLASLIYQPSGWAEKKKTKIIDNPLRKEVPGLKVVPNTKAERQVKGSQNCVCKNGTWTGLNCPYIGTSCLANPELHQAYNPYFPKKHPPVSDVYTPHTFPVPDPRHPTGDPNERRYDIEGNWQPLNISTQKHDRLSIA